MEKGQCRMIEAASLPNCEGKFIKIMLCSSPRIHYAVYVTVKLINVHAISRGFARFNGYYFFICGEEVGMNIGFGKIKRYL